MWFLDNRRISEGRAYDFIGDSLLIKDTSKAKSTYVSCVARGALGTAKRTSKMEIIGEKMFYWIYQPGVFLRGWKFCQKCAGLNFIHFAGFFYKQFYPLFNLGTYLFLHSIRSII